MTSRVEKIIPASLAMKVILEKLEQVKISLNQVKVDFLSFER
jgi:hypothetical protein